MNLHEFEKILNSIKIYQSIEKDWRLTGKGLLPPKLYAGFIIKRVSYKGYDIYVYNDALNYGKTCDDNVSKERCIELFREYCAPSL